MTKHVSISERSVWVIGEILEAEVKDEAFSEVVDVEQINPMNHVWGDVFVTHITMTKFNRAGQLRTARNKIEVWDRE